MIYGIDRHTLRDKSRLFSAVSCRLPRMAAFQLDSSYRENVNQTQITLLPKRGKR